MARKRNYFPRSGPCKFCSLTWYSRLDRHLYCIHGVTKEERKSQDIPSEGTCWYCKSREYKRLDVHLKKMHSRNPVYREKGP